MLFRFIRSLFSDDLLIELAQENVSIKVFGDSLQFNDAPYIAIETGKKGDVVKAIGMEAKGMASSQVRIENPFKHPRVLVADFWLAEKVLQHGILMLKKSRIRPAPRVVMHQLEKTEGGLTMIEERVLRELALGIGAREVVIYSGHKINPLVDTYDGVRAKSRQN